MKLKKWFTKALAFVLAISLAWVPMEHVQAAAGDPVNIPDAELRRYLCERLGKEEGAVITQGDLEGITSVTLWSSEHNVTDLTGLEYCTNLTSFNVDLSTENEDYSFLSNCSKLKSITIEDAGLTVAPDCSNMPNLTKVSLFRCDSLSDISGLANCNNLTYVELQGDNDVVDITPLKGKTGITYLGLESVEINDENEQGYMETISSLVNLETLILNYCDVTDEHISMLDPLTKLKRLEMGYCEVTQPDFLLCHKDTLKSLTVRGNSMGNSDVWKQLTNLAVLGVGNTRITDFSFISSLPQLENGSPRWAEWGDAGFNTDTYSDYYLTVDSSKDSFVLPNPVKNENGNPVAPVASEYYSYNADTNEIIIPVTNIDTTWSNLDHPVEYEFTMTTQTGEVLVAEHRQNANVLWIKEDPKSMEILSGKGGTLSVSSVGESKKYQWYKDGVAIPGATSSKLQLKDVTKADEGSYTVVTSTDFGGKVATPLSVTSNPAVVTVKVPINITGQPEDLTLVEGQSGTLSVSASGEGTLSYQWYKGNSAIAGANTAVLALNNVTMNDAGEYKVVISNAEGEVTSDVATVVVEEALEIVTQPANISIVEGASGSLTVEAVGTGTLSYQWYKGNEAINGATQATLQLNNVTQEAAGEYKVVVTDKNGSVSSRVAVVTVEKALKITSQPTGISLLAGEKGSLSVTAVGEGTLSYQWYKDDTLMDGETVATLNLSNVALSDAGAYKVVVSDKNGSLTSDTAIVVVDKSLKITNQPQGIALVEGKNGSLSVTAVGEGTLSYQWYKGDEAITGATQETLNLTNVSMADAGQYKVVVTDANKSITSNVVAVVVEKELAITKQPTGITLIEGEDGSLLVEAIGADAIAYQWYKDDVVVEKALKIVKQPEGLSLEEDEAGSITVIASGEGTLSYQWYKDGVAIQGETAATLNFKALSLADEGQYMVEIHDKNSVITSDVVEVEIEEEDDEEDDEEDEEEEEVVGVIVSPKTGETGNLAWLLAAVLMALAGVITFKKKEQ